MSISFYMDVHVRSAVTRGLRQRGVDVVTAQEDGADTLSDAELLDRALVLDRVLFTQDKDLLREAAERQRRGDPFAGIVFASQQNSSTRQCIDDLEIIAKVGDRDDVNGMVIHIPF